MSTLAGVAILPGIGAIRSVGIERLLSRRDIGLREKTLWAMLYETVGRAAEILAVNVEGFDFDNRQPPVLFDRQPKEYRDQVSPPDVKARVAIEQASTLGWDRYVGEGGAIVGMQTFGASAPSNNCSPSSGSPLNA